MTTSSPATAPATATKLLSQAWLAPMVAFAVFGALVGRHVGGQPLMALPGALVGALFAFAATRLLIMVIGLANRKLGPADIVGAVAGGLLLLLPFAALALIAELLLGWSASQAFSSAGLMTACGAVGAEVGRRGGTGLRSVLLPTVIAFVLSTIWVLLAAGAGAIWP